MRALLYPIPPVPVGAPPGGFEEVVLELSGGIRVHGWHRDGATTGAPAIVLFHGNGENLATLQRAGTLEALAALGAAVLAVDYPGYGRSTGRPSEPALYESGEAAASWLAARHPQRPLVVIGWSLGAAVGVQLAAERPGIAGLVALSPWCSLPEVARAHYPAWMVRLLLRERYDSLATAPRVLVSTLIVHGEEDWIVPPSQGERLAAAFPDGARWVPVPGAGHNDLLGRPAVWQAIREFLTRL